MYSWIKDLRRKRLEDWGQGIIGKKCENLKTYSTKGESNILHL